MTPALLAGRPLPDHRDDASKHDRGSIVVVGGSAETPGAVLLAGLAALRAGAGRLRIATDPSVVGALGVAVPEARVSPMDAVGEMCERAAAVVLGPGMLDPDACGPLLDVVTSSLGGALVVDAGAIPAVRANQGWLERVRGRCLLVPNPSELERLGVASALEAAERFGCVVAARDADTEVATPDGRCYVDHHGTVGLATSGSGDVAAGLAGGFLARGADPLTAALWMAAVHGLAGERLGGVGFLARELLDVVPGVLVTLTPPQPGCA